jgi:quercetin dioxygenase-like cupin family protein
MGGGVLGGNADATYLTRLSLDEIPEGPWAWVTHRVELEEGEKITHRHKPAFVYSIEGMHDLMTAGTNRVREGQASTVRSENEHSHRASFGPSVFWETMLDRPGSGPPGIEAETLFESPVLVDIPKNPLVIFILVEIPLGGETSIHTHPGPEFIYQLSGGIDYQNGIIGARRMVAGDVEGIPPLTAVQKRNPSDGKAVFLSWFLVDTEKDFASPAAFAEAGPVQNLALMENGASVAGVSSNFGGGGNDSAFGAANALDGDPATEWSSASDGDEAWIEVELASATNVKSVGFWSRTMGDTAQVRSFQVTTDSGDTYGPFTVTDATTIYWFDTQFTAKRLRFELLETSGGNTGALEIEVYGEPVR